MSVFIIRDNSTFCPTTCANCAIKSLNFFVQLSPFICMICAIEFCQLLTYLIMLTRRLTRQPQIYKKKKMMKKLLIKIKSRKKNEIKKLWKRKRWQPTLATNGTTNPAQPWQALNKVTQLKWGFRVAKSRLGQAIVETAGHGYYPKSIFESQISKSLWRIHFSLHSYMLNGLWSYEVQVTLIISLQPRISKTWKTICSSSEGLVRFGHVIP